MSSIQDTDLPAIGVTGVTGALGGLVARDLGERGVPLTVLARRPDAVPDLPGSVVHEASFDDVEAVSEALRGVSTLLMVSAGETRDRLATHRCFVRAATDAGVQHVVYTSFLGAAPDATFTLARDHGRTEEALRASGMAWTFLRDNFYMDVMEDFAGEDRVIRGPAGDGACSLVARADVAAVATQVLLDPTSYRDTALDLTGPEPLTMTEVAAALSAARGRPFAYDDETLEEAYASRARYGAEDWQLEAWVSTYTAIAGGGLARVSGDVERVTGRPATSLEAYLRES